MPLTGPTDRLKGWAAHVASLGKPNGGPQKAIAKAVGQQVREQLKKQFATGTGPTGAKWKETKEGKPALISRKLPYDFTCSPVAKGVFGSSRIPWLRAHHEGHVFPKREQRLTFKANGRLARTRVRWIRGRMGKAAKRIEPMKRLKVVYDVDAAIGERVLPERPIYPENRMTGPWGEACNRGIAAGMQEWKAKVGI